MARQRISERGEGKIGCIVSLLVFLVAVGAAVKFVPEYLAKDALMTSAKDMVVRAGLRPVKEMELQLQAKAREEGILEAAAPGAISISKTGEHQGICTIRIRYQRDIDFYGVYTYAMKVEETITSPYMDVR